MKMYFKNRHLKASALLNAVTISLIVALFCSALIALWYSNQLIIRQQDGHISLIEENRYATHQFLANYSNSPLLQIDFKAYENKGVQSKYMLKPWGIYKALTVRSYGHQDSISKSFLLGNTVTQNQQIDVHLIDHGKPLKYAGTVSFSQNLKIPNARLENHFLPKIKNTLKRTGKITPSIDRIPQVFLYTEDNAVYDKETVSLEKIIDTGGKLINSFNKKTIEINTSGNSIIENITLKGNIILRGTQKLIISTTAQLHDIIIQAPEVQFIEGFTGNVQVIASRNVHLMEGTTLSYPSSIYVENSVDSVTVSLDKKSMIQGGLVINSKEKIRSRTRRLYTDEETIIIGDVFCNCTADLRGSVYGSSTIDRFEYKTPTTTVENLLVNATFASDSIPKGFLRLPLDTNENIHYDIIKEL